MQIVYSELEKVMLIKISEEIDDYKVKEIRRKIDYEIERYSPKKVIFDFNSVPFMDSSGIGMVIGRYKKIMYLGGEMYFINLTDSIRKIFEMSGVLRLIKEIEEVA